MSFRTLTFSVFLRIEQSSCMFYCYILRNDAVRNFYVYVIHEKIAINGYEVITLNIYAIVVIKKKTKQFIFRWYENLLLSN